MCLHRPERKHFEKFGTEFGDFVETAREGRASKTIERDVDSRIESVTGRGFSARQKSGERIDCRRSESTERGEASSNPRGCIMEKSNTAVFKQSSYLRPSDFPLDCESRAFKRFSLRMDRQLRKLVAEWVHLAAPNALRIQRRCNDVSPLPKK